MCKLLEIFLVKIVMETDFLGEKSPYILLRIKWDNSRLLSPLWRVLISAIINPDDFDYSLCDFDFYHVIEDGRSSFASVTYLSQIDEPLLRSNLTLMYQRRQSIVLCLRHKTSILRDFFLVN